MNIWFLCAAIASFIVALLHYFAAGRLVVPPLISAKDISKVPKYFHYYCWHIVTIVLLLVSASFLYCAFNDAPALAVMQTAQVGLCMGWSMVMIVWKKLPPGKLIQWALFIPVFVFGVLGLL